MIHIFTILSGYLIGSIPFALVIGRLFYHTDVREYGSGNLGGGNTARVLGKKAGFAVMALDLLKVTFLLLIIRLTGGSETDIAIGGLAAGIGHCFPLFAGFRGGKAVAALYGFLFGLVIIAGRSPVYFFLPLFVFLVTLMLTRIIAIASIVSAAAVTLYVFARSEVPAIRAVIFTFFLLIVIRHRSNIRRIWRHEENTIRQVHFFKRRKGRSLEGSSLSD